MRKKKQLVVKSTERKLVNRMEGNTHLCRKPHNVSNAESIVFGLYADSYAKIIKHKKQQLQLKKRQMGDINWYLYSAKSPMKAQSIDRSMTLPNK